MQYVINPGLHDVDRLEKLQLAVSYVYTNGVEGNIAEFGTAGGLTARLLANAMNIAEEVWAAHIAAEGGKTRELHLFDSFQGLPDPNIFPVDKDALHVRSNIWKKGMAVGATAAELFNECAKALPPHRIKTFEGWYSDTVNTIPEGTNYALLHIDCDLYSSTCDILHPLFTRGQLSEGCIILFDDWNTNRASPHFGERRAWSECVGKYAIVYSDAGEYGSASHKFIIHSYRKDS